MDYKKLHEWTLVKELENPECATLMRELRIAFYENIKINPLDAYRSAAQSQAAQSQAAQSQNYHGGDMNQLVGRLVMGGLGGGFR